MSAQKNALQNVQPEESISPRKSILVVCGETSSDEHTAPVVRELLRRYPELEVFGMGGHDLQESGMDLTVDARTSASVMGITEVVAKLGDIIRAFYALLRAADDKGAKVALLVDFPDFNLRLAKKLHARGVRVVYYITPQLWAWRTGRIRQVQAYVEKVLPIFPFEEKFYADRGVPVTYVGHPFLDHASPEYSRTELCRELGIADDAVLIALLPGSRSAEITTLMPVMLEAASKLRALLPKAHFIMPVAKNVSEQVAQCTVPPYIHRLRGRADEVMATCDCGVIASGTATVQAALHQLPFCIVYKVSTLTYRIGKLLIKGVSYIGMPNLIVQREVVKEFMQDNCRADIIEAEVLRLLEDSTYRERMIKGFDEMRSIFTAAAGKGSVAENVVDELAPFLK